MKRIVITGMVFSLVFCSCAGEGNKKTDLNSGSGAAVGNMVTESAVSGSAVIGSAVSGAAAGEEDGVSTTDPSPNMTVTITKKNKPMLTEKVDQTHKGIELVYNSCFATAPIKGDDGNCYYFRYQKNKKGGKLTFYKNNAIKVCETVLPEKYKKGYFIDGFIKQGEQFWVEFLYDEESKNLMVPVRIKDGKWGNGIKMHLSERRIYYKDCFYSFYRNSETINITDKKGNTKRLQYEKKGKWVTVQAIIDDKIYYIIEEKNLEYIVMRCNLDGSKKEELFRYRAPSTSENYCKLTMDGDYFYLFDPNCGFTLTRIPLYGGEAEKIVATDWYELEEHSIYYFDGKGSICHISKDLKGSPKSVMEWELGAIPFHCADGHLLVDGYDDEEEIEIIFKIWNIEVSSFDSGIAMNYATEYYWVTENGEVEDTIPGTGLRKKYYEWYEWALEMERVNGPDMDYEE